LVIVLSCLCVFSQKSHFLMVILALEQMTLSCYGVVMLIAGLGLNRCIIRLRVLFLVIVVCEVRVGLGLLVRRCRSSGKDRLGRLFRLE
jgi:NADH:ubiquinone oxidoreductase subunit K